jgi:hypothetical protein
MTQRVHDRAGALDCSRAGTEESGTEPEWTVRKGIKDSLTQKASFPHPKYGPPHGNLPPQRVRFSGVFKFRS